MTRALPGRLARWLPEFLLLAAFFFFALRKLDSFPAAWADDSLFMLVAKMIAGGRGYMLPILGYDWAHPYILAVGPTLIYPVALAIRIFGFSVGIARMPMIAYLLGATIVSYLYVIRTFDRTAARWTTALFVSFSAFINTGKPVLGEIPGFFFLMLGLLLMRLGRRNTWSACAEGAAFGLAVVTKLPFGLVFPALGLSWMVALVKRDWKEVRRLLLVMGSAVIVFAAGAYWLGAFEPGFLREIRLFLFEKSAVAATRYEPIYNRPSELVRIVYGHYLLILGLGIIGWWRSRGTLWRSEQITIVSLITLFALYFLNGPGWYRALLPSSLLLFLFVPAAARAWMGKWGSATLLTVILLLQGIWQFQYRGASPSPGARIVAETLEKDWRDVPMVIAQAEVFVRLSENPNWLYLSDEMRDARRQPAAITQKITETRCLPVLRRVSREDFDTPPPGVRQVDGRYFLFDPPSDCPRR